MKTTNRIEEILNKIKSTGSQINDESLLRQSKEIIGKDYSLSESLLEIAKRIKLLTEEFLHKKNNDGISIISGISSCIYLPDFNHNGEYKLKLIGGSRDRNIELPIDENTLFDVASITKLYTLILLFKLEELGIINLNSKISDLNPDYKGLEDFTFNDLIRLHGILYTNGRIDEVSNIDEANERLKTVFLKSNSRSENNYTDIGAIIMGKTIEKIVSQSVGKNMNFDEIMNEFLIKPLGLKSTMFNPKSSNVTGSGNTYGIVHDPKARILGGAVGSAGLFVNSDDLARLSRHIYSLKYINPHYVSRLGEITFPDSKQSMKGNLGVYVKHPKGLEATYTPSEFSNGSFSHQGWTGSVANFDPNNMIHQNILVNAIYDNDDKTKVKNDKVVGYTDAIDEYLTQITKNTMIMLVIKEYYNRYAKIKEDIDETIKIR